MIHRIFSAYAPNQVIPYMDDLIVIGKTIEQHLDNLEQIIAAISDAGLILNASKCQLITKSVDFLGFHVTDQGISPNEKHVKKIKDIKLPSTLSELRQLCGIFNFF